jgi:hypothetical protein
MMCIEASQAEARVVLFFSHNWLVWLYDFDMILSATQGLSADKVVEDEVKSEKRSISCVALTADSSYRKSSDKRLFNANRYYNAAMNFRILLSNSKRPCVKRWRIHSKCSKFLLLMSSITSLSSFTNESSSCYYNTVPLHFRGCISCKLHQTKVTVS